MNRMPLSTSRRLRHGRPRPSLRRVGSGINGSSSAHWELGLAAERTYLNDLAREWLRIQTCGAAYQGSPGETSTRDTAWAIALTEPARRPPPLFTHAALSCTLGQS